METIERARLAYEFAMLRRALWVAPVVLLGAAIAFRFGDPPRATLLLLPLAVALKYRGGALSRAVLPGLMAGFAALLCPLVLSRCAMGFCMPACAIGGVLSGIAVGVRARHEENPLSFVIPAALIAGLFGAMGCSMGGAFGIAGMAAGLLMGGAPALLVTRR